MRYRTHLQSLVEATLCAALAMILSLIPDIAGWLSPAWGVFPILVVALRRGTRYSFLASFLWGGLHFVLGHVYYLSFWQVILEYLIAFVVVGSSGIFSPIFQYYLNKGQRTKAFWQGLLALLTAVGLKYFCHFIAGVIFWSDYAGHLSPMIYSLVINGFAGVLTCIILGCLLAISLYAYPKIFKVS